METTPNNNKKILWFSVAALAMLAAVTVYALTNPGSASAPADSPLAAITGAVGNDTVTLPAGTPLAMTLQTSLSTKTANVGDRFTARVAAPFIRARAFSASTCSTRCMPRPRPSGTSAA